MTARVPRPAARVLLLDPAGDVLLFRFTLADRPPFWATPGGALEPHESYPAAARRELWEETGLDLDPGPEIARRQVVFVTLEGVEVDADERFFLVRVGGRDIAAGALTALEQRVMTAHRWWTRAELADPHEPYFPVDLLAMLAGAE